MKTTIDAAGRLVIPKAIRDAAGLQPGATLDVRYRDGRVEIEAEPLAVKLERLGRFLVAVPAEAVEPLTDAEVAETREALRGERDSIREDK